MFCHRRKFQLGWQSRIAWMFGQILEVPGVDRISHIFHLYLSIYYIIPPYILGYIDRISQCPFGDVYTYTWCCSSVHATRSMPFQFFFFFRKVFLMPTGSYPRNDFPAQIHCHQGLKGVC